ncbi:hypothetical protein A33Q_3684 [Indibacter alkaliphilus LW1]|uniref:Uncharacterized protein n=1 Tax=Indibacter alkaliphilus (strain CCUG 57479 / KCTC 22604 / LW1) TaxID=1189612 RepID=S2DV54_INDAL|nr:hypothetical protein [Indibacter alkaliphilus]EOZ93738.1 hypothetical protein A33Q_3684 [Indibacter alkaliphilus LW1]
MDATVPERFRIDKVRAWWKVVKLLDLTYSASSNAYYHLFNSPYHD